MNRKNTILLAILINAGLLIILFATAVTTPEEVAIAPTHEVSGERQLASSSPPSLLFGEELDIVQRAPLKVEPLPQVVMPEPTVSQNALAQTPIVHALPPADLPPAPLAREPQTPSPSLQQAVTVKKGDTLEKIAKAHHTTVNEMLKVNQLPSSFLHVGQVLRLPAATAATPKELPKGVQKGESTSEYYTVKVGDNPWTIAMKHHLKVEELLRLNSLNEEKARKLKPGDRLRIR